VGGQDGVNQLGILTANRRLRIVNGFFVVRLNFIRECGNGESFILSGFDHECVFSVHCAGQFPRHPHSVSFAVKLSTIVHDLTASVGRQKKMPTSIGIGGGGARAENLNRSAVR
jgi:hypothetical protein